MSSGRRYATSLMAACVLALTLAAVHGVAQYTTFAAHAVGVEISPASVSVSAGGSTIVDVVATAPAALGLGAWGVDVTYNNAVLTATACTFSVPGADVSTCNKAYTPTTVRLGGASSSGVPASGATVTLARITFLAVGTPGSSSALTVNITRFANPAEVEIQPRTATNGAISIPPPPAAKLAITQVTPSSPTAGQPFAVTVQAQDSTGAPANVAAATMVTLSRKTGTGVPGGALTGTIAAGTNTLTIPGVTYSIAETGVVLRADDDANPNETTETGLMPGDSAPFNVVAQAAITLAPTSGPPLTSVTIAGGGFVANESLMIHWDGPGHGTTPCDPAGTMLTQATASGTGALNVAITVPSCASVGNHDVLAVGAQTAVAVFGVTSPPPTKLAITQITPASPTAGQAFSVTVQAQDNTGAPASVAAATMVHLSRKTGTGVLGGTLTGTIAAGTNAVTIPGVTYSIAEAGVALRADDDANPSETTETGLMPGDSASFTVLPSGGVGVKIDPASVSVLSGGSMTVDVVATAPAAQGLGAWGVDVTYDNAVLTATACTASVPDAEVSTCNKAFTATTVRLGGAASAGVPASGATVTLGRITFQAIGTAGSASALTVNITRFANPAELEIQPRTATNGSITIVPAAAAKYVVSTSNTSPVAGGNVTITAQLADANNNPVTTAGVTVTWTSTGGGSFSPASTSTTNASGVATVTFTTSTTVGTVHTVTATDTANRTGTSAAITTAAAPPAAKLAITQVTPASPTAGQAFSVTVQNQDSAGAPTNVAVATMIHLTLKTGTGVLGGTLTGTMAQGTNTLTIPGVTYSIAEAGVVLRADDDATPNETTETGLMPGDSASFTVLPSGGVGVKIDPASVSVPEGGSTTVDVVATAPAAHGLGAWGVDVTYNNAVLTATACTASVPDAEVSTCNKAYTATTVRLGGAASAGVPATGATVTIGRITFLAIGTLGSSSALTVNITRFASPAEVEIQPRTATSGAIEITGTVVRIDLVPQTATVGVNGTVEVAIRLQAGTQTVDGVETVLHFDPALLEVVDANAAEPGVQVSLGNCVLPSLVKNEVQNGTGSIHFARGVDTTAPQPISGTCTLGAIRFKGKAVTLPEGTPVTFVLPPAFPATKVSLDGASLPVTTVAGVVHVVPIPVLTFTSQPVKGAHTFSLGIQPVVAVQEGGSTLTTDNTTVVTLRIQDGTGTPFDTAQGTPGANLTCTGGLSRTVSAGVAAFTDCKIDLKGQGYVLEAVANDPGIGSGQTLSFNVIWAGDANEDCLVDIVDFSVLVRSFGKRLGDPGFDRRPDFNGDNLVDLVDYSILVTLFGTRCPALALAPASGAEGTVITVTGSAFVAHREVSITLDGTPVASTPITVMADGSGNFTASFTVPVGTAAGARTVKASQANGRVVAAARFTRE